ncbi:MAG: type ISP restriction/modification enzyme, partial [Dongiaceae bacterium]
MLYRPFDSRFTYWTGRTKGFLAYPRREVMQHIVGHNNVGMIFNRQVVGDSVSHFGVSRVPNCHGTFYLGNKGQDYFAPLAVFDFDEDLIAGGSTGRSNLSIRFLSDIRARLGAQAAAELSAEETFHYIYAVVHSPGYRGRYAEFLKIDFSRIPLCCNLELFRSLARLGGELVGLHLMESPRLGDFITTYTGPKNPEVGRVGWSDDTVWLDAAATKKGQPATPGTIGFCGVPEAVWNFHIGGYQVCEKWLKDRKGRALSKDDITHYQKIVVALAETIRLMQEIDEVIERHGGWPKAFQTGDAKAVTAEVIPFRPRIVEPRPEERYVTCVPLVLLKAAAGAFSDPQHIEDDGWEWTAVDSKHRLHSGMFVAQVVGK